MPTPTSTLNIPVLLFPLKIETRYVSDELWLRVLPDEAFLQSHQTTLSLEELNAFNNIESYFDQEGNIVVVVNQEDWEALVNQFGVYRAAYLVHLKQEGVTDPKQQDESVEDSFYYKWLPNQFVIHLYEKYKGNKDDKKKVNVYHRIKKSKNKDGRLEIFDTASDWISDFEQAVEKGMAFKIKADDGDSSDFKIEDSYEKIIVTGYYDDNNPNESVKHLRELIANHLYTEGLSFLDYGTPTNNLGEAKSAFSIRDEFDPIASFEPMIKGSSLVWENNKDLALQSRGVKLAHCLGLPASTFKHLGKAAVQESPFAFLLQKLSWFALGGATLKMLFGDLISNTAHETLWRHYTKYVRAKGPLEAIKIGDQPYGILPVTRVKKVNTTEDTTTILEKTYSILQALFEEWKKFGQEEGESQKNPLHRIIPNLFNEADTASKQEKNTWFQQRLVDVLKMEPSSDALYVNIKKYNAVRGKIHQWYGWDISLPTPLSTLPLAQVYELLSKYNLTDLQSDFSALTTIKEDLETLLKDFLEKKNFDTTVLHAPLLSFQNIKEEPKKQEIPLEDHDIPLFPKDDEIDQLARFIEDWENNSNANELNYYEGSTSLFTDLIFRGFSNAISLYERTVQFRPSNEDLIGYRKLQIGKISNKDKASASEVLIEIYQSTDGITFSSENPIKISAPFAGTIPKFHVKEGDQVRAGMPLFDIISIPERNSLKEELFKDLKTILAAYKNTSPEERKQALNDILDLNSYRLDAWITSFATARLDALRTVQPQGIYLGAYGWVEGLKKDEKQKVENKGGIYTDTNRNDDGGMIHCPTPAQSLTASLFKNSFLPYLRSGDYDNNPYALNLTSDRVQQSHQLMQGIRQDQEIEALLGYKLERWLRDDNLHLEIEQLRKQFPLEVNIMNRADDESDIGFTALSVINGWQMIAEKETLKQKLNGLSDTILPYINKLEGLLDASADHLLFEAGYQLTQGNLTQSAAAMDAAKGILAPPETESLKTKTPGTGIRHQLIYLFPKEGDPIPKTSSKAFLEPNINNWLQEQLGELSMIGCIVELSEENDIPIETIAIKLSDLGISHADFLYLSDQMVSDGASELEVRIIQQVIQQRGDWSDQLTYKITDTAPANHLSLVEALEVAQYTYQLLANSRCVQSDDLSTVEETAQYNWDALGAIKVRIITLKAQLMVSQSSAILAQFDLQEAKYAYLSRMPADVEKLSQELDAMIAKVNTHLEAFDTAINESVENRGGYYQIFEHLSQAAKVLFGKAFILLPPALASNKVQTCTTNQIQKRLIGEDSINSENIWGQERIQNWVQELAQVNEEAAHFEEWQMVNQVWQNKKEEIEVNTTFKIIQYPSFDTYPWVGLDEYQIQNLLASDIYKNITPYKIPQEDNESGYYPQGSQSLVIFAADKHDYTGLQFGIVINEFTEHIPNKSLNTGLSFHYNGPNNEAPQALLLAVPPYDSDSNTWSNKDLNKIIADTMDLMKVRLIDGQIMDDKYKAILPMSKWMNIPEIN